MSYAIKKLDQLTVTRFIAALSVMLFHGGRYIGILAYFPMLTAGPVAVSYFYVLSGFVMALAYYRPGTRFDFRSYGLARFSRIYPVYILAFVLTCVYYIDLMAKIKSDKVLANVFLYQAWIPEFAESFNIAAWSLSVEVFFYVIFPFLLILAMRQPAKRLIWISLGFWVVSQIVHSVLMVRFMPENAAWLAYFPLFHLNSFLLGAAGGIWYVANASQLKVNQSVNRFLLLLALGIVLLLLSLRELTTSFPTSFSLDNGLLAPFFLIIVLSLALDTTRLARGLSHPWLVLLGDASYALYILHIPFRWLLEKFLAWTGSTIPYEIVYLVYVPVSIILCVLVFKYIERPVRDWLRTNAHMLLFIFLDVMLIYIMTRLSFALRLGDEIVSYRRTQNFALRTGLVVFFLAFLVFQFYKTNSWRSLALAVLSGTAVLAGLMYFAWMKGWVEGFPTPDHSYDRCFCIFFHLPIAVAGFIFTTQFTVKYKREPLMSIQNAYNEWSGIYDLNENLTRDLDQTVTREALAGQYFKSVLELGCGTGKNTTFLAGIGANVHALDFSEGMIEKAKEKVKAGNVRFSMADLTKRWPCEDAAYDLITCNLVLEHIEDLNHIFSEAARTLLPNGKFFINELHPFKQYKGTQARFERGEEIIELDVFPHHISDFTNAAAENGLKLNKLNEYWHGTDENKPPRLVSFVFEKP